MPDPHDDVTTALMGHIGHLRSMLTAIADRTDEPCSAEDAKAALAVSLTPPKERTRAMSQYDERCFELAEHFLQDDEPALKSRCGTLACVIQEAIEDWLAVERAHLRSERTGEDERKMSELLARRG
jgi:hypothetical protein